jgi:hypothetical protein
VEAIADGPAVVGNAGALCGVRCRKNALAARRGDGSDCVQLIEGRSDHLGALSLTMAVTRAGAAGGKPSVRRYRSALEAAGRNSDTFAVQRAPGVFTYEDALSASECAALITLTEGMGYEAAPITTAAGFVMRPDIRNNTRVILDDVARSVATWSRLSSLVPAIVRGHRPIGLNERFRFYRYDPGEQFALHTDGCYRRQNGEASFLTS